MEFLRHSKPIDSSYCYYLKGNEPFHAVGVSNANSFDELNNYYNTEDFENLFPKMKDRILLDYSKKYSIVKIDKAQGIAYDVGNFESRSKRTKNERVFIVPLETLHDSPIDSAKYPF